MTTHPHPTHPSSPPPPTRAADHRDRVLACMKDADRKGEDGLTASQIARDINSSRNYVAQTLDRLAQDGLVRAHRDIGVDGHQWSLTPVSPPPTRGHLPIAPAADFDWGFRPTPSLGDVLADAGRLAEQLVNVLARQYDPASAPVGALGEPDVALSDVHLGRAVALVHAAVAELSAVTFLSLPPVGSAVPAHTDVSRDRSGGPGTDSRLRVSTSPYLVYTAGAYSAEGATS